jgi:Mce-associated membrane protein
MSATQANCSDTVDTPPQPGDDEDAARHTGQSDAEESPQEDAEGADEATASDTPGKRRPHLIGWRTLAFGLLPAVALASALAAGWLKWQDASIREAQAAATESALAAHNATVAMLSYQPETVDAQLESARSMLGGDFKNSYTALTHDVVIPGAKQKQISSVATVPAVGSVTATENHSVALVFVDQTAIVGHDAPTDTASVVRVTLDKIDGRWLVTNFEPI